MNQWMPKPVKGLFVKRNFGEKNTPRRQQTKSYIFQESLHCWLLDLILYPYAEPFHLPSESAYLYSSFDCECYCRLITANTTQHLTELFLTVCIPMSFSHDTGRRQYVRQCPFRCLRVGKTTTALTTHAFY